MGRGANAHPTSWREMLGQLGAVGHEIADYWPSQRRKIYEDPVWGSRLDHMQTTPIVEMGLEPFLPAVNAAGYGLGEAINDIANTLDSSSGYQDIAGLQSGPLYEPQSGSGQMGAAAMRFSAPWMASFGALSAGGLPLLASAPLAAAAAEYTVNPYEKGAGPMAEQALPPQWLDNPYIAPFVRKPSDTEHTRRLRQAAGGLVTGALIDAPSMMLPGMAQIPAFMGGYAGIPAAASVLSGGTRDYRHVSDAVLQTLVDQYDDSEAWQELQKRMTPLQPSRTEWERSGHPSVSWLNAAETY